MTIVPRWLGTDDRAILAIAAPTFVTLITEPLMVVIDTAVIGHVRTTSLAGLGLGATVVTTIVGLCIFLAYGSSAAVARLHGAGQPAAAARAAIGALWLALLLGIVLAAALALAAAPLSRSFGATSEVAAEARTYMEVSALGLPAMLVVLAATGALRGTLDVWTPLRVAVAGNLLNVVLNLVLVLGFGLGVGGAAAATATAQGVAAVLLVTAVVRQLRAAGASLRPEIRLVLGAARASLPLFVRTATLRAALLLATVVASAQGSVPLAGHQVATTIVMVLAFAMDSLAIAGQTLVGNALGASDRDRAVRLMRRAVRWGAIGGVAAGLVLLALAPWLPRAFSPDPAVRDVLVPVLVVIAVLQPLSGVVFVLDGILIGAGDARFLAVAGLVVLAAYVPLAAVVWLTGAGLTALWAAYGAFMAARAATLARRVRGERWLVLGAVGGTDHPN